MKNIISRYNKSLDDSLWIYKNIDKPEFKTVREKWVYTSLSKRYLKTILILIKRLVCSLNYKRGLNLSSFKGDTLLYINSENTKDSLIFLKDNLRSCFFYQNNSIHFLKKEGAYVHNLRIPIWVTLFSLANFPFFCFKYWIKAAKYPDLYFENWGKDYCNDKLLKTNKNIKRVVFANDHNVHNRLFLNSCKKMNIKTYYLQHASITDKFPPLSFDYSFLFGEKDFHKYRSIGEVNGYVELVGSPKFDSLYKIRKGEVNNIQTIGIAYNILDEIKKIKELIDHFLINTSFQIVIRPHPGDPRRLDIQNQRISWSIPNKSSMCKFLKNIDVLLAGDSSIHLEALYTNTKSYLINFKDGISDSYEFKSSGIFEEICIKDVSQLKKTNIQDDYFLNVEPFISSVNKSYDGDVGGYLKNVILKHRTYE